MSAAPVTRKAIRHAVAAALLGNTDAGQCVYVSRMRPLSAEKLPAIFVYTLNESARVFTESPRELERTLTLGVEIIARADSGLDDLLDDIAAQVERILSENQYPACAADIVYTGAEITLGREGDNQHGSCVLTYDVTYYTPDVSDGVSGPGVPPENVLTPFETANVKYKVPPFDRVSAEDQVQLPQ